MAHNLKTLVSNKRKKFKQTEIGIIPQEWKIKTIGELFEIKSGITPATKNSAYWDNGTVNWLTSKDMTKSNGQMYIGESERKVTKIALKETPLILIPAGSILLSMVATIGNISILQYPSTFNQNCMSLVRKNPMVNSEFYAYYLKTIRSFLEGISGGTVVKIVSNKDAASVPVPYPPLESQKAITDILGALDSKIALNNKINNILEDIAQTIFHHWFVDYEFPDKNGRPYKSSGGKMVYSDELQKNIPEGWKVQTIGELFEIKNGVTPATKNSAYWDNGAINWLTPKDMTKSNDQMYIGEGKRKVTKIALEKTGIKLIPKGSILLSIRAPVGCVSILEYNSTFNQGCMGLVQKYPTSDPTFYAYYLKTIKSFLESISSGTVFPELSKTTLTSVPALYPPLELQKKIISILDSLNSRIIANEHENYNLADIRDLLLPKLISGKIQVPIKI